jgi:hypothetical protein
MIWNIALVVINFEWIELYILEIAIIVMDYEFVFFKTFCVFHLINSDVFFSTYKNINKLLDSLYHNFSLILSSVIKKNIDFGLFLWLNCIHNFFYSWFKLAKYLWKYFDRNYFLSFLRLKKWMKEMLLKSMI